MNILPFSGVGSCVEIEKTTSYYAKFNGSAHSGFIAHTLYFDESVDLEKCFIEIELHSVTSGNERIVGGSNTIYPAVGSTWNVNDTNFVVIYADRAVLYEDDSNRAKELRIRIFEFSTDVEITHYTQSTSTECCDYGQGKAVTVDADYTDGNIFLGTKGMLTPINVLHEDKNLNPTLSYMTSTTWHSLRVANTNTIEFCGHGTTYHFAIVKFLV